MSYWYYTLSTTPPLSLSTYKHLKLLNLTHSPLSLYIYMSKIISCRVYRHLIFVVKRLKAMYRLYSDLWSIITYKVRIMTFILLYTSVIFYTCCTNMYVMLCRVYVCLLLLYALTIILIIYTYIYSSYSYTYTRMIQVLIGSPYPPTPTQNGQPKTKLPAVM